MPNVIERGNFTRSMFKQREHCGMLRLPEDGGMNLTHQTAANALSIRGMLPFRHGVTITIASTSKII